jgi:hypothetical protein
MAAHLETGGGACGPLGGPAGTDEVCTAGMGGGGGGSFLGRGGGGTYL